MLKLNDFDFHLPEELIAQTPSEKREESKLCILGKDGNIIDKNFFDLPSHLPEGSLIILNNSKVFSSRLLGKLETGGRIELFLLSSPYNVEGKNNAHAICLGRPMKKFKEGTVLYFPQDLTCKIETKYETSAGTRVKVSFNKSVQEMYDWFESYAKIPLPPYIKRSKEEDPFEELDKERYQTVYAQDKGSVAAPTAGLHFTEEILNQLSSKNIDIEYVTLHVGAGTFMPVKTEDIDEHEMHSENFFVSKSTLNKIKACKENEKDVIVVGTTAFRALESLAKLCERDFEKALAYTDSWQETSLFVRPKHQADRYTPWTADAIITNFHQPKSTLFMLISALIGYKTARSYYDRAVEKRYRFFSYGDSNLLWLKN